MIDSRDIKDLHPTLQRAANEFLRRCKAINLNVLITSTLRDAEKQNQLYAQGRTTKGNIVTSVKAGYSYHNHSLAFDFAAKESDGSINWSAKSPKWRQCGEIWQEMGGEWGGSWSGFVDNPHCQFDDGYGINKFASGFKLPTSTVMKWEIHENIMNVKFNEIESKIKNYLKDEFNYLSEADAKSLLGNINLNNADMFIFKQKTYYKLRDICNKNNISVDYNNELKQVILSVVQ